MKAEAGGVAGAARREVGATTITAIMTVGLPRGEAFDRPLARVIIMIVTVAGHAQNCRPEGGEDMAEVEAEAGAGISGAMPTAIAAVTTNGITATRINISIISSPPSMR